MAFFDDPNLFAGHAELEKGDQVGLNELGRDSAATALRKLFRATCDVLSRLDGRKPVIAALCLHRYHVLATAFVDGHVDFIYLHLAETSDRGPKMVLK